MLSFKKGIPIAIVKGGSRDGQYLRLFSGNIDEETADIADDYTIDKIKNPLDRLPPSFFDKYKKLSLIDIQNIRKSIQKRVRPDNEHHATIYDEAISTIVRSMKKEVFLDTGKFMAVPSQDVIERIYISAPTGAGKSTWIGNWLKEGKAMWGKKDMKELFVFSRVGDDKPLDKFKPIRIDINEELLIDPIQAEDLEDSICIFDDIDTIADIRLRKSMMSLRDDLMECGRHYSVRMLITSHLMMNGTATKKAINESSSCVFFPRGGNLYQIDRFLKVYCGFNKETVKKIMALPSRWVMIRKLYPMMVLYERGAFVVV